MSYGSEKRGYDQADCVRGVDLRHRRNVELVTNTSSSCGVAYVRQKIKRQKVKRQKSKGRKSNGRKIKRQEKQKAENL